MAVFLRTVTVTEGQLAPLEEAIRFVFILAILGCSGFTDKERDLLSLSAR